MKFINLLPPDQIKDNRLELITIQLRNFWIWVAISLLVLFVLAFLSQVVISSGIKDTENQIMALSNSLQSADNRALEKQVAALNKEIDNIDNLQNQHYYWSDALVELGNIIPNELVVDILTLERDTGKVKIQGVSRERSAVLEFWANVKTSAYFNDINFPLANLEKDREVNFSYTFFINEDLIKRK
jgi:Tfp pilus assembly protein PilN